MIEMSLNIWSFDFRLITVWIGLQAMAVGDFKGELQDISGDGFICIL